MNSSAVDPLEWYHILQNFPTSNIFDIEGGGHISTLLPPNLTFVIISGSNCHSNVILVSNVFLVKEFNETISESVRPIPL